MLFAKYDSTSIFYSFDMLVFSETVENNDLLKTLFLMH